jgi:Uma2 family endonuclease
MVAMTVASTDFQLDRPLTVEDLDLIQDDGHRYELDDGLLVMFPAPTLAHQIVVTRLTATLNAQAPGTFLAVAGPGVEISPIQYRIPDISILRIDDIDIDNKSIVRPPALVVEVASPSTAIYDRNRKKDVYEGFGIESYWIVKPDLDKPSITAFELSRGEYRVTAEVTGDDTFRAVKPFACEIVPAALVAGPWQS